MLIPRLHAILASLPLLFGACLPALSGPSSQRYYVEGPVDAELVSVIDGDTLMVNARPWPQQTVSVMVRIRGIDTPELRARCAGVRERAADAKRVLAEALDAAGGRMSLSSISGDKYFGRVVADVTFGDGDDAASILLAAGLARPYDGGRKKQEHC